MKIGKIIEQRIIKNCSGVLNIKNVNFIFTKENGDYVGTDIIKKPYSIIHKELGIKKCRFYDLRGSYATKILRSGVEIKDVAEILGHKNIETTENYYISSDSDSRKVANDLLDKIASTDTIYKISNYRFDNK